QSWGDRRRIRMWFLFTFNPQRLASGGYILDSVPTFHFRACMMGFTSAASLFKRSRASRSRGIPLRWVYDENNGLFCGAIVPLFCRFSFLPAVSMVCAG